MHARKMDFEPVEPHHIQRVPPEPMMGTAIDMPDTSAYGSHDEITDWVEDLDMSLAPAPEREATPAPRRSRAPWILAGLALLIAAVMGLGFLALGLVAAVAIVLLMPVLTFSASGPAQPTLTEVMAESVAPVVEMVEEAPEAALPTTAPSRSEPARSAPAPGEDAADEGKSDADLVLMPDPAFDDVDVGEAIRRLKEKVSSGDADARVGR